MTQAVSFAMVDDIAIVEVATRRDASTFWQFPYDLYRSDCNWVPPLRGVERRKWLPRYNPALRSRWTRRFLAHRGGDVVGRIAAVIDPDLASRWRPGAGCFGFFECIDSESAARGLLDAAEGALRERGCTCVLGPVNLTTHDEVGLLTEGFDSPALLLTPYNPACYPPLLEASGYVSFREYHAYAWTADVEPSPALRRVVRKHERALDGGGWTFRGSSRSTWSRDRRAVFELYNDCFRDLWGFVPMTWPEFRERSDSFRGFYRPELCVLAEREGVPEGFGLVLPDIHQVLKRIPGGRVWPWGWWRLFREVPRIRTGRMILLGVRPAARGAGIGALIGWRLYESVRKAGFTGGEVSLIQDANRQVEHLVEAFGFPKSKSFRLYEKDLVG